MNEWKEIKLGKLADIQTGPFGSQLHQKDYVPVGTPLITVKNLGENKVTYNKLDFVSNQDKERLSKFILQEGDIVFSRVGYVDRRAYITKYESGWLFSGSTLRVRVEKTSTLNPRYLSYYFGQQSFREEIKNMSVGATRPSLNTQLLEELEIIIPSLPEQSAITGVLSSLDDKIDLLHHQNKTLEAMAEALFRQWLVEEADAGLEEIPLDEIADYLNGLACQKYPPKNEIDILPVLKIKELRNGFTDKSDWASTDIPDEYFVQSGDIIFSWSGSLMVKIWDGADCILNQHLFKVTSEHYPKWFYYLWTKHHMNRFISIAEGKATTMGHIKRGDLSNSKVLIPETSEFEDMDKNISPMVDKIVINNCQIRKLESMRNLLLPKLMIGEVRVNYEDT